MFLIDMKNGIHGMWYYGSMCLFTVQNKQYIVFFFMTFSKKIKKAVLCLYFAHRDHQQL